MYGKPPPKRTGNGISGWWKNKIYFRSLLELAFLINAEKTNLAIESAERKEYRFKIVLKSIGIN